MNKENLVNIILEIYYAYNLFLDDFFSDSEERKENLMRLSEEELLKFLKEMLDEVLKWLEH